MRYKCESCDYHLNGQCRRYPPTISGYPSVLDGLGCGEWNLDGSTRTVFVEVIGEVDVDITSKDEE